MPDLQKGKLPSAYDRRMLFDVPAQEELSGPLLMCTRPACVDSRYNLTPCGLPTSSLTGGGGVQLPGGCGQLDHLLKRVGR